MAPALRIAPLADDGRLRAATAALLQRPPDVVVANTAVGMRGWLEAADKWGLGDALRANLAGAYLVASGPKARTALRAAGLREAWVAEPQSNADVLEHLVRIVAELQGHEDASPDALRPAPSPTAAAPGGRRLNGRAGCDASPLRGRRIAVQLHGEPQEEFCGALAEAGAEVIEVPVYRFAPPVDPTPLQRLVDLITNRLVDAVTFTSAPACNVTAAGGRPGGDAVLDALRTDVLAGCVGPVTAAPLRGGVPVLARTAPASARSPRHWSRSCPGAPGPCGWPARSGPAGPRRCRRRPLKPLPPAQMAMLRALAASPGKVLPRSELLEALPRGADEHAVEMAIARLRAALGGPSFIQTVVKRGYRLRVE